MKLTKYGHACVVLEEQGKKLVIDPGAYSGELPALREVVAVVVTHEHYDHFDPERLQTIMKANPGAALYTPSDAAQKIAEFKPTVVTEGASAQVGPFKLDFKGKIHALVHPSFPRCENVGVLVNNGAVYFPGDSFTMPDTAVNLLLLPVSGPWHKFAELVDYLDAIKPKRCVPTHNVFLSEAGDQLTESMLSGICQKHGISYTHLNPGQSTDV